MATTDLKQYWQELARKNGIPEEKAKSILEALEDETVSKAFAAGFKTQSDYSRDLDNVRDRTKEQVEAGYKDWYAKAQEAYEQNLRGLTTLQKYRELYGDLEDGNAAAHSGGKGMTQAELDEFFGKKLRELEPVFINLSKAIARTSADHAVRFKETLDVDAVEKLARDKGLSWDQAYKEHINPRLEETTKQEWEGKLKAAREEGARDALSRHKIPIDSKPKEAHPFFDRKEPAKDATPTSQERHSRDSFLEAWDSYAEPVTNR